MPEDLRLYPQDIKEIAANINQDLLAACQAVLYHIDHKQPIDDSVEFQVRNAIKKPELISELVKVTDIYERHIVIGEVMAKINDKAVYDLLRGIVTAICLAMTEDEASELIEQINAQAVVSQYGYIVGYWNVIRR